MSRSTFLMVCFCTVLGLHSLAQPVGFSFQHLTIENGLSHSTVFTIAQDKNGFIWVGTRNGLNRYDAHVIKKYFHNPDDAHSLSDNNIYCIKQDAIGRLWVGTGNGLSLYNPRADNFTDVPLRPDGGSNQPIITVIQDDKVGNMWIGTRTGLFFLGKNETQYRRIAISSSGDSNDIRSIFIGLDNTAWVGTSEGLLKIVRAGNTHEVKLFLAPKGAWGKINWVNDVTGVEDGLLIGTQYSGVMKFNPTTEKFSTVDWIKNSESGSETIRKILPYNDQKWIATMNGIYVVDENGQQVEHLTNVVDNPTSLTDNSVRCMFVDRNNSMWIGTFYGGVNTYNPLSRQFGSVSQTNGLNFKIASSLVSDNQGNLWIGSEGNGLFYKDCRTGKVQNYRNIPNDIHSLSHNNVKTLLLEEGNGLWIGTVKGLNYLDLRTKVIKRIPSEGDNSLPDDMIYALAKDRHGKIWIGTYRRGLSCFDPSTKKFTNFSIDPPQPAVADANGITALTFDSDHNLWVGTTSGLNVKDEHTALFKRVNIDVASQNAAYILCIFHDRNKRTWVGTRGNGLHMRQDANSKFTRIADGKLGGNAIHGIQQDQQGYLWITSDLGLTKLDPNHHSFHNYTREDGLVCKEFNFNSYCKDNNGMFYFGGYDGIVKFDPNHISKNRTPPGLRLTNLKVFNKDVAIDTTTDLLPVDLNYVDNLTLNYKQNVFTVEFAVLNFINPEKNIFAYKLEGFEKEWNITSSPVATYMNLSPGDYTLVVRGANNDGVWSEHPLRLALTVQPPPWRTWWAYTIYSAAILGLLWTWARFNRNRLKLEHELEIEHLEIKKQDEIHQAKLSFFANIIHEIRTPLTLMISPLEKMMSHYPGDNFIKRELSLVQKNTNRLHRLMNQLLDFHKQETGNAQVQVREDNLVDLLEEIYLSFKEYADSRKVQLHFHAEEHDIRLWFDREEMSKVFSNLLINAFKFTPGGGTVSVNVSRERSLESPEKYFAKVRIKDTGLGISKVQLEKIFHRFYQAEQTRKNEAGVGIGLALSKGIIDLHHGTIVVESEEATNTRTGFTEFTITLPSGNTHYREDQIASKIVAGFEKTITTHDNEVPEKTDTTTSASAENERPLILVLEDDADVRAYTCDLLSHSYDVIPAADGESGLQLALHHLPDLVVSDVVMPGMNGLDLVKNLKADIRTSHIPVILLTARAAMNYQIEGFDTGADDYLTKPFNAQLLELKIKNHLLIRERLKEKYSRVVTLQPQVEEVQSPDDKFLQRLMKIVDESVTQPDFNVSKLVREIGMSRPVLFRKIKMLTGMSVIDLIRDVRLKKAAMLLQQKKLSVAEVAFTVGFTDPKYFSKTFRNHFGKSPSQFVDEQ